METKELQTAYILDIVSKCEDPDELKGRIIPLLNTQQEQWKLKINDIIAQNKFNKTSFANACGVSRVTVDKWCKGSIPKNRETFLRLGLAAHFNREQMNQLLQRYGHYPALYPKSLEDCVCIYVINTYENDPLTKYDMILESIKSDLVYKTHCNDESMDTVLIDKRLSEINRDDELERFITQNAMVFSSAYHKFYAYVKMCIKANYAGYADSVFELAEGQGWSSSLRHCVSAIRQNKWYPTRNKIISLGLHLSMDHEQIDEMLELAHMEPLCPKNIFENVIIFILEDASLNDMINTESENFDPDELCRYAREVLKKIDMPEFAEFITELPDTYEEW